MEEAEEKGYRVIILGDLITSILPNDKRHEIDSHVEDFSEQEEWLHDFFERFQDTIEWVGKGNHEGKLIKKHGDFLEKITNRYEIRYLGFQLNALYKKQYEDAEDDSISIYMTHGTSTFNYRAGEDIRRQINKRVRVKDLLKNICEADFYIQGHAHQGVMYTPPFELTLVNEGGDKYKEKYLPKGEEKIYCCIPSMLRTYHKTENYAARSGVSPSEVGCIDLHLDQNLDVEDVEMIVSHQGEFIVKDSYNQRKIRSV